MSLSRHHAPRRSGFRVYRSKRSELTFPHLAIIFAVVAAALVPVPAISIAASTPQSRPAANLSALARGLTLVQEQDDNTPDEDALTTDQVDKYIAVYSAMQKNHSLGVEQAASKQGLTVDQFRTLEDKIERNPIVHQRVLDALKASASGGKAAAASSGSSKTR